MWEPEYFTCAACGKEFQSAKSAADHRCKTELDPHHAGFVVHPSELSPPKPNNDDEAAF